MNLYSLTRRFPTETDALDHLVKTRWPKGVRCVSCDHGKCWLIESTNKTGGPRRLFQCAGASFSSSATAGTLFHDSHLPLTKWFAAISLMSDAKKGISASQLGRHIGMTYKTAWYVAHRIREAMREAKDIQLGDPDTTVEIDEAYIGGQLRHKGSKIAKASKTMVIGMAERNGRIHLESMSNRRFEIHQAGARCQTRRGYKRSGHRWQSKLQGPHRQRETRERKSQQGTCESGVGPLHRQWKMRFRFSSGPSSATITSSVPGTSIAICASSAGGTIDAASRRQSSKWRWRAWPVEHRYRTRRWLRSKLDPENANYLPVLLRAFRRFRSFALISARERGLDMQHPLENRVEPLLRCSLAAHRQSISTRPTCVIGMIILLSNCRVAHNTNGTLKRKKNSLR